MTSRGVAVGSPPWLVDVATCDSTNDWALARIDDLAHGVVVTTADQTAGRGRSGQAWLAPAGAVAASFIIHLPHAAAGSLLSLAAGVAVVHAIEDVCPRVQCSVKWPNDVYLDDRKLAGILCEARTHGSGLKIVVGIGINRAVRWTDAQQAALSWPATSLSDHTAAPPTSHALIAAIREHLLAAVGLLRDQRWDAIGSQLEQRDWLRGRLVTIHDRDLEVQGSASGIDDQGRLLITTGDGFPQAVSTGTVTILDHDGGQKR